MKISPWEIYWVMQLDSIGGFFWWAGFLLSVAAVFAAWLWVMTLDESDAVEANKQSKKWLLRFLVVGVLSSFVATLTPSTKTAAAMIVIPSIANNDAIKAEAGDLYALAKDALREAAHGKAKEVMP